MPYIKPRQQLQVISPTFWEGSSARMQLCGSDVAWTWTSVVCGPTGREAWGLSGAVWGFL